jgi:hypothetical protein
LRLIDRRRGRGAPARLRQFSDDLETLYGAVPSPHINYYPKGELRSAGSYSFDVHLGKAEHGSIRKTYVVIADEQGYREITDEADAEGILLKLPDGVRRVSNPVTVKRW